MKTWSDCREQTKFLYLDGADYKNFVVDESVVLTEQDRCGEFNLQAYIE